MTQVEGVYRRIKRDRKRIERTRLRLKARVLLRSEEDVIRNLRRKNFLDMFDQLFNEFGLIELKDPTTLKWLIVKIWNNEGKIRKAPTEREKLIIGKETLRTVERVRRITNSTRRNPVDFKELYKRFKELQQGMDGPEFREKRGKKKKVQR